MELGPSVVLFVLALLSGSKAEEIINADNLQCIQKCQTDGQAKIATATQNPGSLDAALEAQKRMCEVLKEAKACLFNCQNGEAAWEAFKSASGGGGGGGPTPAEICGLGSNGNATSPKLCIHECQIKSAQGLQRVFGEGPLTAANQSSLTDQLDRTKQACQNYKELKHCFLGCPGGETNWKEFVTETSKAAEGTSGGGSSLVQVCGLDDDSSSGTDGSGLLCIQECQLQSAQRFQKFLPSSPDEGASLSPDEALEQTKKTCDSYKQLQQCFSGCPDGDAKWQEFTTQSDGSSSSGGSTGISIVKLCGLDNGNGGTGTPDLCPQECQVKFSNSLQTSPPSNPEDDTPSQALERTKKTCKSYKELKQCYLGCPNGDVKWKEFTAEGDTNTGTSVAKLCGLDDGHSGTGSPELCIQECQVKSSQKFQTFLPSSADEAEAETLTPGDALERTKKICEGYKEMKTCFLGCPNGKKAWNSILTGDNGSSTTSGGILQACGLDDGNTGTQEIPELCVQECQLKSSQKFQGFLLSSPEEAEAETLTPEKALERTKKICEGYKEMKTCLLTCPNGKQTWSSILKGGTDSANASAGILQACGLDDGDVSSEIPGLCVQECQIKSTQKLQTFLASAPGEEENLTAEQALERAKKSCEVYREMKACILSACPNGKQAWNLVLKGPDGSAEPWTAQLAVCGLDGEGGEVSSSPLCMQECQIKSLQDFQGVLGNSTEMSIGEAFANTEKACQGYRNMRTCILACPNGQASWDEFVEQSGGGQNSSEGTTALQLCGLVGDSTSTSNLCTVTCHKEFGKNVSSIPMPGADATPEDALELAKHGCKNFKHMRTCLLACPNGKRSWDKFVMNTESDKGDFGVIKICGLSDNGDSGAGYLCVRDCQLNFTIPSKRPTNATSLSDILSKQQKICEDLKEFHTCTINCPSGQKVWNESPKDGFEEVMAICGIDTGKVISASEKVPHQCYDGMCVKCSDIPGGTCLNDFVSYDSADHCQKVASCFKYDASTRIDPCAQGAHDITLPSGQDRTVCGGEGGTTCESGLMCNPVFQYGQSYCCPDTEDQNQKTCVSKCRSMNVYAFYKLSQDAKQSFQTRTNDMCQQYDVFKSCIMACPNGEAAFEAEQEKMKTNSGGIARDLASLCQSKDTPGAGSALGGSSNCPDSDGYPDYCRIALQQKGQDMCFLEGFKNSCAKTCCSVTLS